MTPEQMAHLYADDLAEPPAPATLGELAELAAMDRLLQPKEVARILAVTPKTLEGWRREGRGPRFFVESAGGRRGGIVRYHPADVAEYIQSRRVRSTAERRKR